MNFENKSIFRIFLALSLVLSSAPPGYSEFKPLETAVPGTVPGGMNYQGRLEQDGFPVTGTKDMEFKLFDAANGGNELFNSGVLAIPVSQGVFSAVLNIPTNALNGTSQRFIEVTVQGVTLTPRDPIRTVPYAAIAETVEGDIEISTAGLSFNVGAIAALVISSITNNVGVGTGTPNAQLEVVPQVDDTLIVSISSQNATPIMVVDVSGRWGLGVGAPVTLMDARSDGAAIFRLHADTNNNDANVDAGLHLFNNAGTQTGQFIFDENAGVAGVVAIGFGANQHLNIDPNGLVGFGSVTPVSTVDVRDGKLTMTDADVAQPITTEANAAAFLDVEPLSGTAGGVKLQGISDTDAGALVIDCFIGAANPTDATPACAFNSGKSDGGTGIAAVAATETAHQFQNAGTAIMTLMGDAKVGINTNIPQNLIHIFNAGAEATPAAQASAFLRVQNSGAAGSDAIVEVIAGASGNSQICFGDTAGACRGSVNYVHTGDRLDFGTSAVATGMSLTATGAVGIQTTTPGTVFDVNGTAQFGSGATKSTFTATGALDMASGVNVTVTGGGIFAGNATTASALAADPTDCGAGLLAAGINAAGVAQGCTNVGTQTELDAHAALTGTAAHSAASANTFSQIVTRDGAGNFSATTITANLTGNASGTAGSLAADPTDCGAGLFAQGINAAGVAQGCTDVGTQVELDAHINATSVHAAASANTVSRLVIRDGAGDFSAGTITMTNISVTADDGLACVDTALGTGVVGDTVCGASTRACFAVIDYTANDSISCGATTADTTHVARCCRVQ